MSGLDEISRVTKNVGRLLPRVETKDRILSDPRDPYEEQERSKCTCPVAISATFGVIEKAREFPRVTCGLA